MSTQLKDRKRGALLWLLAITVLSVIPTIVSAQPPPGGPCPWCTTPTTCSSVEESTPIAACYIVQGGQCATVSGNGCTYVPPDGLFASAVTRDIMKKHGVDVKDFKTIPTARWGNATFATLADGSMALWNCQGHLIMVVKQEKDGVWVVLDPTPYRSRYSLVDFIGELRGAAE